MVKDLGSCDLCPPSLASTLNLRRARAQADGERLPLVVKDLGSCDLCPPSLALTLNLRRARAQADGERCCWWSRTWAAATCARRRWP